MSVTSAFFYIYTDKQHSNLIGSCKIEVHSCVYLKIPIKTGVKKDLELKIVNSIQNDPSKNEIARRTVELFSSNSQLVFP